MLLDFDETAKRYKVTPLTVRNWLKKNPLFPKPITVSFNCVRFRLEDLLAFEQMLAERAARGEIIQPRGGRPRKNPAPTAPIPATGANLMAAE